MRIYQINFSIHKHYFRWDKYLSFTNIYLVVKYFENGYSEFAFLKLAEIVWEFNIDNCTKTMPQMLACVVQRQYAWQSYNDIRL